MSNHLSVTVNIIFFFATKYFGFSTIEIMFAYRTKVTKNHEISPTNLYEIKYI
jgi:hypothetical protein